MPQEINITPRQPTTPDIFDVGTFYGEQGARLGVERTKILLKEKVRDRTLQILAGGAARKAAAIAQPVAPAPTSRPPSKAMRRATKKATHVTAPAAAVARVRRKIEKSTRQRVSRGFDYNKGAFMSDPFTVRTRVVPPGAEDLVSASTRSAPPEPAAPAASQPLAGSRDQGFTYNRRAFMPDPMRVRTRVVPPGAEDAVPPAPPAPSEGAPQELRGARSQGFDYLRGAFMTDPLECRKPRAERRDPASAKPPSTQAYRVSQAEAPVTPVDQVPAPRGRYSREGTIVPAGGGKVRRYADPMSLVPPNAYDRTAQQVVRARAEPAPEMPDQIPAEWLEEQEVVNPVSDAQGGVPSGVKFVGLPQGYAPVQEDLPRPAPAEADAKLRPPMRIARELIGWPHTRGESQRYADELVGGRPTDPSVVSAGDWMRPAVSPFNGDGVGTTIRDGKVNGMGLWPSVSIPLIGTLAAAEARVLKAEIEGYETQLGNTSPSSLSKVQDKYAAERATYNDLWTPIESSSVDETTLATAWAVAAVRYRDGLKGAVSATQDALKKSGVLAPVVAAAKAAALPVGILAVGVGAAALYWLYLRKKH